MAVPSCPSLNPVLATTLPLVLSLPPNMSPDVEALRLSLLGVSAVHQASGLIGPAANNID